MAAMFIYLFILRTVTDSTASKTRDECCVPSVNNFVTPPFYKVAKLGPPSKYYTTKLPNDLYFIRGKLFK